MRDRIPGRLLSWSSWREFLIVSIIFVATWLPRALARDQYVTIDEPKWAFRSANFYFALSERAFADTYQREHPGVTAMWAGTAGLLWRFPEYLDVGTGQSDYYQYEETVLASGRQTIDMLVAGRFFMILANTVALTLAFVFAKKLIGLTPAFLGFLLIAFDPFQAGHTQLLHLDGMSGCWMLLSLLAFLSYSSTSQRVELIISGVAAGLGFLTKSTASFLLPVIGLMALLDLWNNIHTRSDNTPLYFVWRSGKMLILWGVIALAVFTALWPAMWIDPVGTVSQMFGVALEYAEQGHSIQGFFNGEIFTDGRIDAYHYYFYPITYLWRSTPVTLVGLIMAMVAFVIRYSPFSQPETRRTVIACVLLALVFTFLMNLGAKKGDRYLLPVYAPLDLVAAIGWVAAANWLKWRFTSPQIPPLTVPLLGIVIAFQLMGSVRIFPYLLSYYNPLMGGGRKAPEVVQIGWGEGLDQAARYLNEKLNADQLRVSAWYTRSFSYYFSGETLSIPSEMSEDDFQRILASDYAVIYIHQWQRQLPKPLLEYLSQRTPEHSVWINRMEYVRIYKLG